MPPSRRIVPAVALVMTAVVAGAGVPHPGGSAAGPPPAAETDELLALRAEVARLRAAQERLESRISTSDDLLDAQAGLLAEGFDTLDRLSLQVQTRAVSAVRAGGRDHRELLREEILRPVFQVTGEEAVGSAVLIHRGVDAQGSYYLALSCQHVLRDILAENQGADPAEFRFRVVFDQLGDLLVEAEATMVAENSQADLALLRIREQDDLGPVARIAPLRREAEVRPFTSVYTVGCPLGTGVQATLGEITRADWTVSGEPYWMVSSPAFFGNSGGGVFLADTQELVGIFSKIYTHGSYRPQVVTHMGLAVPLPTVHAWLREIGYGELLPAEAAQVEEAGAGGRIRR